MGRQGCLNSALAVDQLDEVARLDAGSMALLRRELEHDRLSGRGFHRIRRVARTIADLRGHVEHGVEEHDVALALRFRATIARMSVNGRAA
jgi:magnesium chelatase family protein